MATGTLTNLNDAVTAAVAPSQASALLTLAGTYAGGPVAFERSVDGGAGWQSHPVTPAAGGPAVTSLTLSANQAWGGWASLPGLTHLRVRATGAVGGATASVVPSGAGVGGVPPPVTGSVGALNDVIGPVDVSSSGWMGVTVNGSAFNGVLVVESSPDLTTWTAVPSVYTLRTGATAGNLYGQGSYGAAVPARYARVRVSQFTSGTAVVTTWFQPPTTG
jgi:hypothetical protein